MNKLWNIVVMMVIVATFSACSNYRYYTAGKDEISLQQYKTFALAPRLKPRTPDSVVSNKRDLGARLNYVNNNRYYNNPEALKLIQDAAVSNLQSKGFTLQPNGADLLVRFSTLVDRGTRTTYRSPYFGGGWGWGPGWGWGWGRFNPYFWGGGWGGGYAYPTQEHFKEGVLSIELIDARTKEPVWIGYSSGELSRDPQKVITQLPKIVEDIFKRLPVRS
jgi:hypothetical protein